MAKVSKAPERSRASEAGSLNLKRSGRFAGEATQKAEATFEQLMKGVDPKLVTMCKRLRKMIKQIDPQTVETVRLGDNAATYGVGPRKMTDGYAYIMPMSGYVNLGFYQGAQLPDPFTILEGTGKGLRHIKLRTLGESASPVLRDYVAAALQLRR